MVELVFAPVDLVEFVWIGLVLPAVVAAQVAVVSESVFAVAAIVSGFVVEEVVVVSESGKYWWKLVGLEVRKV